MRGIKLNFSRSLGPTTVDFSETASGFESAAQNAMVNLVMPRDSDPLHPDRGTDLFKDAVVGSLVDVGERAHATALAAEQTRLFLKFAADDMGLSPDDPARMARAQLSTKEISLNIIVFNAVFNSVGGEQVGMELGRSV